MDKSVPTSVHFEHAIGGHPMRGYGQLWFSPSTHLEFTEAGLRQLAAEALALADAL